MQKIACDIIGTHLEITLDTQKDITGLEKNILARLGNFEEKFSRFIEGNWLYNLNKERRGFFDEDGERMLGFMLPLAHMTDGYFDPTVGKRLTELGYGKEFKVESSKSKVLEQGGAYGDYRDIEITGSEILLHGNILLEFGGIGKGYLIDILVGFLQNFERFLVNFGGDFYGRGGWKIGLESPFASDEIIGTISLENKFLACSAPTRRKWGNQHHLIDPHSHEPSREVIAAYIEVAGNAQCGGMTSDGYATTLCVMPWELAKSTLQKTPEISGVIVGYDGSLFQKEGSEVSLFS